MLPFIHLLQENLWFIEHLLRLFFIIACSVFLFVVSAKILTLSPISQWEWIIWIICILKHAKRWVWNFIIWRLYLLLCEIRIWEGLINSFIAISSWWLAFYAILFWQAIWRNDLMSDWLWKWCCIFLFLTQDFIRKLLLTSFQNSWTFF